MKPKSNVRNPPGNIGKLIYIKGRTVVTDGQSQQPCHLENVVGVAGINPRKGRLKMLTEMSISQFRSWLNDTQPDDLVAITPLLFNRIGNLDQHHQERIVEEVQSDPRAKSVFKKLNTFSQ